MKVRIAFRSDIVLEGETMQEIKEAWDSLPLYSEEACNKGMEFLEMDAVEDGDTNEDLMHQWDTAFNSPLYWDEAKEAVILNL